LIYDAKGWINMALPETIQATIEKAQQRFSADKKGAETFAKCFASTFETTTEMLEDGTTFVITGDIPAMWLRDSSAQVRHYLPLAKADPVLRRMIEGLVRRQVQCILTDPYANAFNKEPNDRCWSEDRTEHNPWVWERKYEVDSLCNPLQLAYLYWQATGSTAVFDQSFRKAVDTILSLWQTEQRHGEQSPYYFERSNCPDSDTLKNEGRGMPVNFTGMTWSGFRPSDDACKFGYLIPSNMFAVVVLRYIGEIAVQVYHDEALASKAHSLMGQIDSGIQTYGIVDHYKYGKIYAYETDGFGNYNLMDDANVPSLLAIPYLGYAGKDDPIYQNTRKFLLSTDNPSYFEGKYAKGIGSPHTPHGYIWPISLAMQALTSDDANEVEAIVNTLLETDGGTGFMHESFNPDNPTQFTREWFAWANSLFGELVYRYLKLDE
jgi:uncharacterized protein